MTNRGEVVPEVGHVEVAEEDGDLGSKDRIIDYLGNEAHHKSLFFFLIFLLLQCFHVLIELLIVEVLAIRLGRLIGLVTEPFVILAH